MEFNDRRPKPAPAYHVSMHDAKGRELLHEPDYNSDSLKPMADAGELLSFMDRTKTGHRYDDETGKWSRGKVAGFNVYHPGGYSEKYVRDAQGARPA